MQRNVKSKYRHFYIKHKIKFPCIRRCCARQSCAVQARLSSKNSLPVFLGNTSGKVGKGQAGWIGNLTLDEVEDPSPQWWWYTDRSFLSSTSGGRILADRCPFVLISQSHFLSLFFLVSLHNFLSLWLILHWLLFRLTASRWYIKGTLISWITRF